MIKTTSTTLVVVLALTFAACGGNDDGGGAATTESPPTTESHTLTVRVTADQSGFGCTESTERSGLSVGNHARLTVTDEDGTVIGTGAFALSPGLTRGVDTCDWTAEASVKGGAEFYTLDAGGELATFSEDELTAADWAPERRITVSGDVVAG